MILGLLLAFAAPGRAEESHRGFFEADLAVGGKAVFFIQGNHALSVYVFNVATSVASFAGGDIADDSSFSVVSSTGATISGSIHDDDSSKSNDDSITATVAGQTVTASRAPTFGPSDDISGHFTGTASAADGSSFDVKIVIDSQNRIFFIAADGSTVLGGFGLVTLPKKAAAVTAPATDKNGADDPPGHDIGDDHGQDADDLEDFNEDLNDDHPNATFSLTLLSGEAVTGTLTYGHGAQLGDFTLGGATYFFRAPQESSENHLVNISARGFVSTGQSQLIGGFIVTGGPKLVLIRALGPSLTSQGVSPVLANPILKLMSGATELRSNDDWQNEPNSDDIVSTTIPPSNANESSILIRLEPGAYTAVVTGANDATGIALIEVYEIDHD
ncbi:MAG: hypothetical protein H0X34_16145 [Chthoniobacterales bacterium]|nr:hypothetical protein [Chthoniobacterales bacterium]